MKEKTFVIDYDIYFTNRNKESHIMKVKNCMGELHAKLKLDEYLKKKHNNFQSMVVTKCVEDIFSMFGDMFGKDNPFNF